MRRLREPPWGFAEILIVYLGILLMGFVFGMSDEIIRDLFAWLKVPDSILSYFYLGFIMQFAATVFLVLLLTVWLNRAKLSDLGFNRVSLGDFCRYGLLGGLLLITVIFTLSLPLNFFKPDLEPQLYEEMLRMAMGGKDFLFLFIIGAVLAPFAEELFYRGMMYPIFRRQVGPLPAMLIAGTLFGIVHFDPWRVIPLAIGGTLLCYLYEKTNSIYVTTVAHGIWNGLMTLLVFYVF